MQFVQGHTVIKHFCQIIALKTEVVKSFKSLCKAPINRLNKYCLLLYNTTLALCSTTNALK